MIINQFRSYGKNHTDSEIYVNGGFFGHGLEDTARPVNVKIPSETCIPPGTYRASVSHSPAFNREMVILWNQPDMSIERDGVRFSGIRIHGGNDINHTAGCILVAEHSDKAGKVWGSLESEVTALVRAAEQKKQKVYWVISDAI